MIDKTHDVVDDVVDDAVDDDLSLEEYKWLKNNIKNIESSINHHKELGKKIPPTLSNRLARLYVDYDELKEECPEYFV